MRTPNTGEGISHACNYEHPCQITMHDVEVGMADSHSTSTMEDNYGYAKKPILFKGMQDLLDCPYLGGPMTDKNKAKVIA